MTLYEGDFHAWALEQAALARSRTHNGIDWENVAEELESLGKQQRSELASHYRVLLMHLLKWRFQPNLQSHSWRTTIRNQRREIARQIRKNPSLQAHDAEVFADAYEGAVDDAVKETGLPERTFPAEPPFTMGQALDENYWPEADD